MQLTRAVLSLLLILRGPPSAFCRCFIQCNCKIIQSFVCVQTPLPSLDPTLLPPPFHPSEEGGTDDYIFLRLADSRQQQVFRRPAHVLFFPSLQNFYKCSCSFLPTSPLSSHPPLSIQSFSVCGSLSFSVHVCTLQFQRGWIPLIDRQHLGQMIQCRFSQSYLKLSFLCANTLLAPTVHTDTETRIRNARECAL